MKREIVVVILILFAFFAVISGCTLSWIEHDNTSAFGSYLTGVGTMMAGIGAWLGSMKILTYFQKEKQKNAIELMVSATELFELLPYIFSPFISTEESGFQFNQIVRQRISANKKIINKFNKQRIRGDVLFGKKASDACDLIWQEYARRVNSLDNHRLFADSKMHNRASKEWKDAYLTEEQILSIRKKLVGVFNAIRDELNEPPVDFPKEMDERIETLKAEMRKKEAESKTGDSSF